MLFQKIGPWNGIRPRPILMISSDVVPGLSMASVLTTYCKSSRMFSAAKSQNFNSCTVFSKLKFCITFENSYHVIPCDVKYDGDCIPGLTFV
jgi:hypothetical protein